MNYVVIFKSGSVLQLTDLTPQDVDKIRYGPDETIGFGTEGAFFHRSEVVMILPEKNYLPQSRHALMQNIFTTTH